MKAFGYEITVRFQYWLNMPDQKVHYRGCTEAGARRKGMLKSHAQEIVHVEPVTREQWIRAFGLGSEKRLPFLDRDPSLFKG